MEKKKKVLIQTIQTHNNERFLKFSLGNYSKVHNSFLKNNVIFANLKNSLTNINFFAIAIFLLITVLFTYEVIPFNEELIVVGSVFLAFITIDKMASQIIYQTFQFEQQSMVISNIKKCYDAFLLCLLQKKIEKIALIERRKKKIFVYSFIFDLLVYLNYFDYVLIHFFDYEEETA